ncbi:MAG: hypothetical protein HOP29_08680 [Phycisphaerales bacterium]|nr:hypothetical protein [Phycisphaerales bacterium]
MKTKRRDRLASQELIPTSVGMTAPPTSGDVPTRVRIAPWGEVHSTTGRFVVDEESAALVLAAFEEHGADLPIDYEHQTLGGEFASPSGQAPAAGWIKRLEARIDEGIFAIVEWTKPAAEQLAAKQYRYLSPVALVRRGDRRMVALHSVALTNKPAIVHADPIVNRTAEPSADRSDAIETLVKRLDLPVDADVEAVLVAASRRFDELDRQRRREDCERRVGDAVRAGRLTEAQRDVAVRLAMSDAALFDEWLSVAPVVLPLGRTRPPEAGDAGRSVNAAGAAARLEFRTHPELALLTSEAAFVADAVRRVAV